MNEISAVVGGSKRITFNDKQTGELRTTYLHRTMCGKIFSADEPIQQGNFVTLQEKKAGDINPKTGQPVKQDGWLLGFDLGARNNYLAAKENTSLLD